MQGRAVFASRPYKSASHTLIVYIVFPTGTSHAVNAPDDSADNSTLHQHGRMLLCHEGSLALTILALAFGECFSDINHGYAQT